MKKKYLAILLILAFQIAMAQEIQHREVLLPEEVRTSSLDLLYVDEQGFLWVAAGSSLFWYDGLRFNKLYTDTTHRKGDQISALFMDSRQQLWLGWRSGHISRRSGDTTIAYAPEEGTPAVKIVAIVEDQQNRIWLAADGEGLYLLTTAGRWINFNTDDGLPSNESYDLVSFKEGVYLATDQGLAYCNYHQKEKIIEVRNAENGLSDQIVKTLFKQDQDLWMGFYEPWINLLDSNGQISQLPTPAEDVHQFVRSGYVNWWLSERGELYRSAAQGRFQKIEVGSSDRNRVEHMALDKEGHLWVSTRKGLYSFDLWLTRYSFDKPATALCFIDSLLYYGREGDLLRVNVNSGRVDTLWQGENRILTLYADADQRIWAGTFDGGALCWHRARQEMTRYTEEDGLVNNNVLSISGNRDAIWFGTLGGVSRAALKHSGFPQFTTATDESGHGLQYIYAVEATAGGEVYLGTDGRGVLQWHKGHFRPLHDTVPNPVVLDLSVDNEGKIWWLSPDGRLYCSRPNGEVKLIPSSKRESGRLAGIEVAPDGTILKFSENLLERYLPQKERWEAFGQSFGLTDFQPELHAQAFGENQQVFCGTASGISVLRFPLLAQVPPPTTFLEEPELFLKPTAQKVFSASNNHLTFNYIGRWYIEPEAVEYRIKLEGYDLEWNLSQNVSVTYPRLAPGQYNFKVIAGVNGYFPSDQMKSYSFTILQPWYLRWYWLGAAVLLLAGLIYSLAKWRIRLAKRQQEQEKERVRAQYETLKSQVNPHFLFNSFNTLMALIDEHENDEASRYLSDLSDFFRNILEFRTIDLINLADELKIVETYLNLQRIRFGENLQDSVEVPDELLLSEIPPLSLQILVENAFKHNTISKNKPLQLRIFAEGDYLVIWNKREERQQKDHSTGYGLDSLVKKYSFYTKLPVEILADSHEFAVRLPLLNQNTKK